MLRKILDWAFKAKHKEIRIEASTKAKVIYVTKKDGMFLSEEFEPYVINNGFFTFVVSGKERAENRLEKLQKQTLIFLPGKEEWVSTTDIESIFITTEDIMIKVFEDETFEYVVENA